MKKFLAMATVVGAAFTSCVNDNEAVYQQEDNPQPITFEVATYKPASRADDDFTNEGKVEFETTKTFGTFAYESATNVDHNLFMNNVEIGYFAATTPYWAAKTGEYFWPESEHVDFISYAPYNAYVEQEIDGQMVQTLPNSVPQILDSDEQQTLQYVEYTVDAANPEDLMYSDKAVKQTRNTGAYWQGVGNNASGFVGVPTIFHHALAKLNFRVKVLYTSNILTSPSNVTSWKTTIKRIKLDKIYTTGSVQLKTNSDHAKDPGITKWVNQRTVNNDNVWNVNTARTVTSKEWTHEQVLSTDPVTYGVGTLDPAQNYFILPQSLYTDQQQITIVYQITTTEPDGDVVEGSDITRTVHFKNYPSVAAWEMGKNITYTIEIDPAGDIIHFAPAVVDWEAAS